jgi:hypothetical protein
MNKLLLMLCLTMILSFSQANVTGAASTAKFRPILINVNGEFIQTGTPPEEVDHRVLIPIRSLSTLGLTYVWDGASQTVTISNASQSKVKVTLNSKIAYKNDKPITLDVPAQMKQERVYLPIRFVTEAFDSNVQFETIRQIVFVTSKSFTGLTELTSKDLQKARQAAISLPIQASFKLLHQENNYLVESYDFLEGKADEYIYMDGYVSTIVSIKNGKAVAIGQFTNKGGTGSFDQVAGDLKDTLSPAYQHFVIQNRTVYFSVNHNTTALNAGYRNEDNKAFSISSEFSGAYENIIIALPDGK